MPPTDAPRPLTRALECAHLTALGVWFGAVAMSGVVAAVVFPLMRDLDPTLGAYGAYAGDHAPLAAGRVAARVFLITDSVQFVTAGFVLATTIPLIAWLGWDLRRIATAVRLLAIGGAMLAVSYRVMVLAPRMDANARAYWDAAAQGDTGAAESSRAAFGADHPLATRVVGGTTLLVFIALVAGAWDAQGGRRRGAKGAA